MHRPLVYWVGALCASGWFGDLKSERLSNCGDGSLAKKFGDPTLAAIACLQTAAYALMWGILQGGATETKPTFDSASATCTFLIRMRVAWHAPGLHTHTHGHAHADCRPTPCLAMCSLCARYVLARQIRRLTGSPARPPRTPASAQSCVHTTKRWRLRLSRKSSCTARG